MGKNSNNQMLSNNFWNNSDLLSPNNTVDATLGEIHSKLKPGESTNITFIKNRDDSATLKCPEQGETIVVHPNGKGVRYSYEPKKK